MNIPFEADHILLNGEKFIPESRAIEVYSRIYQLLKDQKEYFKTKSPSLKESCKKREWGFIKWYEQNYLKPQQHSSQQEMNL